MSVIWISVVIDINRADESEQIIDYTSAPVVQQAAAAEPVGITPV